MVKMAADSIYSPQNPYPLLILALASAEATAWVATISVRLSEVAMVLARLVSIGNLWGIRLAKPLLEVAVLADEVEIEAVPGVLTIRPSTHPRAGFAEAAAAFAPHGLFDEMASAFLADHLAGGVYFRTERPGQNLARALVQFRLTESIEAQQEALAPLVARLRQEWS